MADSFARYNISKLAVLFSKFPDFQAMSRKWEGEWGKKKEKREASGRFRVGILDVVTSIRVMKV